MYQIYYIFVKRSHTILCLRLSWRERKGEKKTLQEESVCSENEVYISGGIRAEVEWITEIVGVTWRNDTVGFEAGIIIR